MTTIALPLFFPLDPQERLWPSSQALMFWVLSSCLSGQIPWMYIKIKHFGPLEVIWPCVGLRLLISQASQNLPERRMLIKCLWMKHCNYHVSCWIWQSHCITSQIPGTKCLQKPQKEGKLILILLEGAGHHDGEVLAAELGAAGHVASLVSKQRAMDAHS